MRHYPKATPRRVWVIGASGLALCYPMRPRAKPSTRAALAAAFGPAPLVVGPASPALPSATPAHERRTGVIPSLNPGRSSRPRRGIRRPDGSGGNRELTTRTDLQAQQNDLIGSIADPASIEPNAAPIGGSVRHVKLNAGHTARLRRRSGLVSTYGSVALPGRQQDPARHAAARRPADASSVSTCRPLTTSTRIRPFCESNIMSVRRREGLWRFGVVSTATSLTLRM